MTHLMLVLILVILVDHAKYYTVGNSNSNTGTLT